MYTIEGKKGRNKFQVQWDDGEVSGEEDLVQDLRIEAELQGPLGSIPGPLFEGQDIFNDGIAFYVLTKIYFDDVKVVRGELPEVESVPKGATP